MRVSRHRRSRREETLEDVKAKKKTTNKAEDAAKMGATMNDVDGSLALPRKKE